MVRGILGSPGLVGAAEEGDFFGDEFPGGCLGEVTVVGWVISQLVLVTVNCLRVFVPTEGFVYGFLPWGGEFADVGKGVGGAPFVLTEEVTLDLEEEVVLCLIGEHVWRQAIPV